MTRPNQVFRFDVSALSVIDVDLYSQPCVSGYERYRIAKTLLSESTVNAL